MKHRIVLFTISLIMLAVTSCDSYIMPDNWAAAKVAGRDITFGEIRVFKQNRGDDISQKDALDMIIEREVLFEESKAINATASLKEAKKEAHRVKMNLLTSGSQGDKKRIDYQMKTLGLSYDEYWDEYLPQSYVKLKTMVRMKNIIREQIGKDILENYPHWNSKQVEDEFGKLYGERLSLLNEKYDVEYYLH